MSRTPARPKPGEPITLVVTKDGQPRYRTMLDHAPVGQPRQQRRATFGTLTEARAHVAQVKAQREAGSLPTRDRETFGRFADEYLAERRPRVRPVTLRGYESALRHPREAFGDSPVGKITEADVERMVDGMAEAGRTRRTVALTLMLTRSVLARAMRQGAAVRNVAASVEAHGGEQRTRRAVTVEEVRRVSAAAEAHRLHAAWTLTLAGMRRSEVLGLRWQDLTLSGDEPTLTVAHGRVGDGPDLTPPKTARGARVLPLTPTMAAALRSWRSHLAETLGLVAVGPEAFVVVDEAGRPVRPEVYSDEWVRLCHAAGIGRRVLLHEARHSSVTMMRAAGVPDRIVAAWHGHDESVMRATYDHADGDRAALAEAAAVLSAVQRAAGDG